MQPSPHGPKATAITVGRNSASPMKAPQAQANSQRTTTAPTVKQPSVAMIRDTKTRTARERMVDAYNATNPSHSGADQAKTMLEREKAMFATPSGSGAADVLPGRKKQAQ